MKEYYGAKDVQRITGCGETLAYRIIRKLREDFEREYPNAITIQGKIPIWYFEDRMVLKRKEG